MNGKILHDAHKLINGPRQASYGKPDKTFRRIAIMWSAYLNSDITAADVACMMDGLIENGKASSCPEAGQPD